MNSVNPSETGRSRRGRPTIVDVASWRMRQHGKCLKEIAKKNQVVESTVERRIAKVDSMIADASNTDPRIVRLRNTLIGMSDLAAASVEMNLRVGDAVITNAYLKGLGVYQDKVDVEVSLNPKQLEERRERNLAAGMARFGVQIQEGEASIEGEAVNVDNVELEGDDCAAAEEQGGVDGTFGLGVPERDRGPMPSENFQNSKDNESPDA